MKTDFTGRRNCCFSDIYYESIFFGTADLVLPESFALLRMLGYDTKKVYKRNCFGI